MSLFNFIRRIFKVGGPQINLVTQNSEFYPSDLIRGELQITAPAYKQSIESITVNLKEFWVETVVRSGVRTGGRASRYHQHDSVVVVNNYEFLPGMEYKFPFETQLPNNCRVSSDESGWRLGVVVSTYRSFESRVDFDIDVRLSKAFQKIIESVERDTKFTEVSRGRKFISDTSATRFIFRPPEYLQSEFQYLMLDVSFSDEGGIKGNMLFNKGESGLFSQFTERSDESYSHEFHIKSNESFDSESETASNAVTNILSEKLTDYLGSKNH